MFVPLIGALFIGVGVYQAAHGFYFQAAGAFALFALIAYSFVKSLRGAFSGREAPPKRRIYGWAPPRSPAVMVLTGACIVTSIVGWFMPNHWYIEEGTVGRIEVWNHQEWWRLATSPFLHANYMHLYFNMFALWFLGREIDSSLGTSRFLLIYLSAALGGGLMVVAAGQEHTLGASGAIYGLMGALLYFGFRAWKANHRIAARRMLFGAGALIGINLLFSFSIPFISIPAHVGGLVTGFIVAVSVGVPHRLIDAWALSDRCPPGSLFSYDVNAGRFSYHGRVDFALRAGLIPADATAVTREAGWATHLDAADLRPETSIDCYADDPYPLLTLDTNQNAPASAHHEAIPVTT